jgi:hypothetical protein
MPVIVIIPVVVIIVVVVVVVIVVVVGITEPWGKDEAGAPTGNSKAYPHSIEQPHMKRDGCSHLPVSRGRDHREGDRKGRRGDEAR